MLQALADGLPICKADQPHYAWYPIMWLAAVVGLVLEWNYFKKYPGKDPKLGRAATTKTTKITKATKNSNSDNSTATATTKITKITKTTKNCNSDNNNGNSNPQIAQT